MNNPHSTGIKVARWLLGAAFALFGLNYFLNFMPTPPPSAEGGAFLGALAATGYMFPSIKLIEVVSGVLLLSGRFVPFALVLLAPIVFNIVGYHAAFDGAGGLGLPLALTALGLVVAWGYRDAYRPLFATPANTARDSQRDAASSLAERAAPSHG